MQYARNIIVFAYTREDISVQSTRRAVDHGVQLEYVIIYKIDVQYGQ